MLGAALLAPALCTTSRSREHYQQSDEDEGKVKLAHLRPPVCAPPAFSCSSRSAGTEKAVRTSSATSRSPAPPESRSPWGARSRDQRRFLQRPAAPAPAQ